MGAELRRYSILFILFIHLIPQNSLAQGCESLHAKAIESCSSGGMMGMSLAAGAAGGLIGGSMMGKDNMGMAITMGAGVGFGATMLMNMMCQSAVSACTTQCEAEAEVFVGANVAYMEKAAACTVAGTAASAQAKTQMILYGAAMATGLIINMTTKSSKDEEQQKEQQNLDNPALQQTKLYTTTGPNGEKLLDCAAVEGNPQSGLSSKDCAEINSGIQAKVAEDSQGTPDGGPASGEQQVADQQGRANEYGRQQQMRQQQIEQSQRSRWGRQSLGGGQENTVGADMLTEEAQLSAEIQALNGCDHEVMLHSPTCYDPLNSFCIGKNGIDLCRQFCEAQPHADACQ